MVSLAVLFWSFY